MKKDYIEIYDDLNEARVRMNELDKEYEEKGMEVVVQPFDDENNNLKYGLFVEPIDNNIEYVGFFFDYEHVYYERCKKLIKLLKENVPSLEWEKTDDEMKEFEEIWQFGSVPIKAYIAKENANYKLRVRDFGETIDIGIMPKSFVKHFEKLQNKEIADSKIFLKGGLMKKKRPNKAVKMEYEYQIEYNLGYYKK